MRKFFVSTVIATVVAASGCSNHGLAPNATYEKALFAAKANYDAQITAAETEAMLGRYQQIVATMKIEDMEREFGNYAIELSRANVTPAARLQLIKGLYRKYGTERDKLNASLDRDRIKHAKVVSKIKGAAMDIDALMKADDMESHAEREFEKFLAGLTLESAGKVAYELEQYRARVAADNELKEEEEELEGHEEMPEEESPIGETDEGVLDDVETPVSVD